MDSGLFEARVRDTANICLRTSSPKFLGFLTPEESAIADSLLKSYGATYSFYGGYEDAQRRYLACIPDWCDRPKFPIAALTFEYRSVDKLSHRDFLGSLMALGITRESVGDILVGDGRTVVFLNSGIADHVTEQISKIGRVGVTVKQGFSEPLPTVGRLCDFSDTVPSTRLDCIVAAVCSVSRSVACELIESGLVSVNSFCCEKNTKNIVSGDKVTVRGKGKFVIESVDSHTKKGRIILKYKKYV